MELLAGQLGTVHAPNGRIASSLERTGKQATEATITSGEYALGMASPAPEWERGNSFASTRLSV